MVRFPGYYMKLCLIFFFVMQSNLHHMELIDVVRNVPYLFTKHIKDCRWIFFPTCVDDHWTLYAVDTHETAIKYYNSLLPLDNKDKFKDALSDTYHWIKSFMSWRFGKNCVLHII